MADRLISRNGMIACDRFYRTLCRCARDQSCQQCDLRSALMTMYWQRCIPSLLVGLCALVLLPVLQLQTALAQIANAQTDVAARAGIGARVAAPEVGHTKPYFIEFRARAAQSYGHTFSVFGRTNGQGKIVTAEVAGLHPFTESAIPWMIGHFVVVPSEVGASDGDTEDQYVIARFRILLNEAEYKKVTKFIKQLQNKSPLWHAVLYNCNAFVGDIARFMGLETPASTLAMPKDYIDKLRDLNIRRSTGVIGTPVEVEDAATLRAAALRDAERHKKPATVGR